MQNNSQKNNSLFMRRLFDIKGMYLPAIIIVFVVLVLTIFISISTYKNFNRAQVRAYDSASHLGILLFKAIENDISLIYKTNSNITLQINNTLNALLEHKDINYIILKDSRNTILYPENLINQPVTDDINKKQLKNDIIIDIKKDKKNISIYEMTKIFNNFNVDSTTKLITKINSKDNKNPLSVCLGIKLNSFEEASREDFHHSIIMIAIVIALGIGGFFFIFVIQTYYSVDKRLKHSQDYNKLLLDNMANGLLSIDLKGEIISYNILAIKMLEIDEKEAIGLDLNKLIDFKASGINKILSSEDCVLDHEILFENKSGQTIPLAISATPIPGLSNNIEGVVIVLRDLKEIKWLQDKVKQAEKFAAMGKLAANMAHEIRNPLSSIKGFAQFFQNTFAEHTKEREYAEILIKEVDRINRVINDLLTLSKPVSLEVTLADIPELIKHSTMLIQADTISQNINTKINIDPKVNRFWLDPNQIIQALLNLLLNALDAVAFGGEIEIGASIDKNESLNIWVYNEGEDISKQDKEKIFDPFFTLKEKGTGLGLAIVNKIIVNHKGDIKIDCSHKNHENGICFTICIPKNLDMEINDSDSIA